MKEQLQKLSAALAVSTFLSTAAFSQTLTVYFNAGHAYDSYMDVIAQFESDNPGWDVQFERFQWPDMRTKLVTDFAAGSPPDLVAEPGGWVADFAQQGLLTPMNRFMETDDDFAFPVDWQESSITKNTWNDEIYGVQIHLTCATLVYNIDLLKEAGYDAPPTNWVEFREISKATTKAGVFGFAPNPSIHYYFPWLYQNQADWYDTDSQEMVFGSDEAVESIQFLSDMIHQDRSAPPPIQGADYEGPQKLFTAGRAAMIITGPWDVTPIRTGNPDLNWAVAPSLTGDQQATIQGGVSLMIPKDAKHPEQAWDLITRLTATDVQVETSLAQGMTMPRKSWLESKAVQDDPILKNFGSCLPYSKGTLNEITADGKYSSAVENVFLGALEEVVYSNEPAAEVLPAAEDEANRLISQN